MTELERMSERNLLYRLCQSSEYWQGDTKPYYNELKERLDRYIEIKVRVKRWQTVLHRHQDDISAETIRRLVTRQADFKGNSLQFRKYIRDVVFSVCAEALKRHLPAPKSLDTPLEYLKDASNEAATLLDVLVDPQQETPEAVLIDKESQQKTQQLVKDALTSLDESCSQLLHRAYILRESQKEVAEDIGLSASNARVKLLRCRESLIRSLLSNLTLHNSEGSNLHKLNTIIAQLPEPEGILVQAWWRGETRWKYLGELIAPQLSQSETKALFARGISRLFTLLFDF